MQGTPAKETKIQDLLDALMGEAPAETTAAPTTAGTNTACQDLVPSCSLLAQFFVINPVLAQQQCDSGVDAQCPVTCSACP